MNNSQKVAAAASNQENAHISCRQCCDVADVNKPEFEWYVREIRSAKLSDIAKSADEILFKGQEQKYRYRLVYFAAGIFSSFFHLIWLNQNHQ